MDKNKCDFSGWATRNDLKCADGRIIKKDAFLGNDGLEVPLLWGHEHNSPDAVLGHALLENRDEGVYAYGSFNDTESGKQAKALLQHGDVRSLSIYANGLKQVGNNVIHGVIRELSLVLAGANPGAYVDFVMAHDSETEEGMDASWDENIMIHSLDDALSHGEKEKEDKEEMADNNEETVGEIFDTLTEKQKTAVYALVGQALEEAGVSNDDEDEGGEEMKHNLFDTDQDRQDEVLMHDGLSKMMKDAKRTGSLREEFLAHAADYGIENIEFINSEEKNYYDRPEFIRNNPVGWISTVINGVHNTPFDKVRTIFANITEDEARAKGYIKGKYKKEEVFKLLKRTVSATTIYKKQKFDRDDLIDLDFDAVPWIKEEMNMMLDEEKARAYIFGDGRSEADEDKINETHIIPVIHDDDLFSIKVTVIPSQDEKVEEAVIDAAVLAQDDYQGSGNTVALMESKVVTRMLILKDQFGHRLYKNMNELAAAMGVGKIEKVPSGIIPADIYGVILDLKDYNVGEKNGGKKQMFDDFDIDFNQQKYLLETRQSGALVRPYSAIVLKKN